MSYHLEKGFLAEILGDLVLLDEALDVPQHWMIVVLIELLDRLIVDIAFHGVLRSVIPAVVDASAMAHVAQAIQSRLQGPRSWPEL